MSDLPIVAHMTLEDDGSSLEGVAPEVFGPRLAALPVQAVGVNCSVGPAAMLDAVERMAGVVALPISAQPMVRRRLSFQRKPEAGPSEASEVGLPIVIEWWLGPGRTARGVRR